MGIYISNEELIFLALCKKKKKTLLTKHVLTFFLEIYRTTIIFDGKQKILLRLSIQRIHIFANQTRERIKITLEWFFLKISRLLNRL